MRAVWLIALAVGLVSCKPEPTFDERYEAAEHKMLKTAGEIDAELERAQKPTPPPSNAPEMAAEPVTTG